MLAKLPGPTAFWQTTTEPVFDEVAGARDARCVVYRSIGGLLFSALVIAATVSIFVSNDVGGPFGT